MRTSLSLFALPAALLFTSAIESKAAQLTDVVVFNADTYGNYAGGSRWSIWNTRPGDVIFNVWVQQSSGSFLTGPADSATRPNITLAAGVNTFNLFADPGGDNPFFGISLFFDGATAPAISAYAPLRTAAGTTSFAVDAAPNTPDPILTWQHLIPAAGTLSFISGNQQLTLTDFFWATPSVYHLDLVGPTSIAPDAIQDYVGGITLSVTTIPEPSLLAFAGIAVTMLLLRRRRE